MQTRALVPVHILWLTAALAAQTVPATENLIVPTVLTGNSGDFTFEFMVTLHNDSDSTAACNFAAFADDGTETPVRVGHFLETEGAVDGSIPVAGRGAQLITVDPAEGRDFFSGWIRIDCDVPAAQVRASAELTMSEQFDPEIILQSSSVKRSVTRLTVGPPVTSDAWLAQQVLAGGKTIRRESGFSIVNPSDEAATLEVRLSLPGFPGFEGAPVTLQLAPRQRIARFLEEIIGLNPIVILPPPVVLEVVLLKFESSTGVVIDGVDVLLPEVKFASGTRQR